MAVDRVEQLLHTVATSFNQAGIEYAIIGGNAIALWVSTVDESAVRATKGVDVLIRRDDLERAAEAMGPAGMIATEVLGVHMFVNQQNPNPKTGVHLIFSDELIRPEYAHHAPDPSQSVVGDDGFRLIELAKLIEMKLQAYQFIDRVHIQDLLSVGLIDQKLRDSLPDDLRTRLEEIETTGE